MFSGRWELVLNGGSVKEPIRVYPLPPLMSKMVHALAEGRYENGVLDAQVKMRRALGL